MKSRKKLNEIRMRREKRSRARITGTADKPRLSVFRSNKYVYAQLIDDKKGHTLASASGLGAAKNAKDGKTAHSGRIGEEIAKKASGLGIKQAVFDRGSYKYHGRVKAVAEGAKKGGLKI